MLGCGTSVWIYCYTIIVYYLRDMRSPDHACVLCELHAKLCSCAAVSERVLSVGVWQSLDGQLAEDPVIAAMPQQEQTAALSIFRQQPPPPPLPQALPNTPSNPSSLLPQHQFVAHETLGHKCRHGTSKRPCEVCL